MNWAPVYALLLLLSTLVTYFAAVFIEDSRIEYRKKLILYSSLIINFGILFLFKYYNFINSSAYSFLEMFGIRWEVPNLDLLLPVGISFYTFQAVGYLIDVYRKDLKAERHFGKYALFVSFFPQLVAGPIERATNLLPQFHRKHYFEYERVVQGLKLMLWGYFMKLVVADRLALYVDSVYNNVEHHNGTSLLVATIFFTFQIYCDFAGYSYIAIGCAKIMGFDLMLNFNRPYFAKSIPEFWRRWHISLSTWFRDYLYIPLGGNRVSFNQWQFNLIITFLVSGIWHGANWTFVMWGGIHGLYQISANIKKKYISSMVTKLNITLNILSTFLLVSFTWIFFRANTITDAFIIIGKIFSDTGKIFMSINPSLVPFALFGVLLLMTVEFVQEFYPNKIPLFNNQRVVVRYVSYASLVVMILLFGVFDGGQFIYFQF